MLGLDLKTGLGIQVAARREALLREMSAGRYVNGGEGLSVSSDTPKPLRNPERARKPDARSSEEIPDTYNPKYWG